MHGQQIGGEKPVIDNEKLPSAAAPRHLLLQYRDEALLVEKVIRDERTDTLLDIMTAVELVVNAMGFDVELGVNADGDFVFYDDSLSDEVSVGECFDDADWDNDYEIESWPSIEVGSRVRILEGVLEGKTGTVNSFDGVTYGVVLDDDRLVGKDDEIAYLYFELEVIG